MPHFIIEYADNGDVATRAQKREAHVVYRKSFGPRMALAEPVLDAQGRTVGSVIIVDAADQAEAERIATNDPLVEAGVLSLVSARPYRIGAMYPPAG